MKKERNPVKPNPILEWVRQFKNDKKKLGRLGIAVAIVLLLVFLSFWLGTHDLTAIANVSSNQISGAEFQDAKDEFVKHLHCISESLNNEMIATSDSSRIDAIQRFLQFKAPVADSNFLNTTNGINSYDIKKFEELTKSIDSTLRSMSIKLSVNLPNCTYGK